MLCSFLPRQNKLPANPKHSVYVIQYAWSMTTATFFSCPKKNFLFLLFYFYATSFSLLVLFLIFLVLFTIFLNIHIINILFLLFLPL